MSLPLFFILFSFVHNVQCTKEGKGGFRLRLQQYIREYGGREGGCIREYIYSVIDRAAAEVNFSSLTGNMMAAGG